MSSDTRLLALLRAHGWNATSFQVLEPGYQYWFTPQDEGDDACVAYCDTGGAWVVAGAPIAREERFAEVVARFAAEAARAGRRVSYFAIEQGFIDRVPLASLVVGEQAEWDPQAWEAALRQSRSLREQLRRARAKGVRVRAVSPAELSDPVLRRSLDQLIERWQRARPMAPMGFLVQLHLHDHIEERRLFVAEVADRLVGMLGVVPVYARRGWFLEDLLRAPGAPNGTAELLVDSAMRAAAAEGLRFATMGLAPLAGLPPGMPAGIIGGWLRAARRWSAGLYDFEGLRSFKAKLRPQRWVPIYLAYDARQGAVRSLYDVLVAFSREGLLIFGLRTLLRAPAIVVRVLALLLLPWTALLALADAARWFPSAGVRWSWVGLDGVLLCALLWLSRRWRVWLGLALACVVTADAALTLGQVLVFNLPRARGPADLAVLAVAVLAPAVAAVLLWTGQVHRTERRA